MAGAPPSVQLWLSVREGGDTKTKKSRRTLGLPKRCVTALRQHQVRQEHVKEHAGPAWNEAGLVFSTSRGRPLDAANVRRSLRYVLRRTDLDPAAWTPRELRHSFVSLLSSGGVSIEEVADFCGHSGTTVTETVYRHELRPMLLARAAAMDRIFPESVMSVGVSHSVSHSYAKGATSIGRMWLLSWWAILGSNQ